MSENITFVGLIISNIEGLTFHHNHAAFARETNGLHLAGVENA